MLKEFAFLFLVGFLWGATNPFIKKSSAVMNNISFDSVFKQIFVILKFYVTNWKCTLPFFLNQFGALIYFVTLQDSDMSLAVPVTNALAFMFTTLVGNLLGEQGPNKGIK
ncbi:transmembrane protein 234 homolog [Ctenocephalides felis]|uniref:transmembrane protein 234 homolog n=1 Tax=Ctenocephalides felis TaxID=7515 RepID=UPI000E6E3D46|nr:transmembrane protein 234 homolog [Ctenocephalides felis]